MENITNLLFIFIGVVGAIVVLLTVLTVWQPFSGGYDRSDIPDRIRFLLTDCENGSYCRFDHVGSNIWFSIERKSGDDESALLALRIPKVCLDEEPTLRLYESFAAQGFEFSREIDNISLLGEVLIPVENIWDAACGSTGAHAARVFLDQMGIGSDSKFTVYERSIGSFRSLG